MFLRGVANTFDNVTRVRPVPDRGAGRLQDVGLCRRPGHQRQPDQRLRRSELQRAADRRDAPLPRRTHGRLQYQYSRNEGHDAGLERSGDGSNTFDYNTEFGTNLSDIPHTFNGSLIYLLPVQGLWTGGWRVGGILNARSGVPINVTINRPDTRLGQRRDRDQHPGRQHARHAASRSRARRRSLPEGRRALVESRRVRGAAARHVRQPAAQLPARPELLAGRPDGRARTSASRQTQGIQVRLEFFNITNRLNYENPAASLPAGTVGQPFTDAVAGTFGYMLGPLNRTVGLGTARQTQIAIRYLF